MKRAIITGATGVLGTALINELIKNNIEVLVLTRKDSKRNNVIPSNGLVNVKYYELDKFDEVENDTNLEYDVFYHLAWEGTTNPYRDDCMLQSRNIGYSLKAVDCAKRFGCKKFVGAGSQAEYGLSDAPLKPSTPCNPIGPYGMAKLCSGYITKEYAHQIGLEHNWVRVLSIYGPNDGKQSMIMSAIDRFINSEKACFTKAEQMWDYLYSEDAAKAFRLVGEKGIDGKTYVLGSGKTAKLKEYIESIRKTLSSRSSIDYGAIAYSMSQTMYLCADISELNHDTGWKPETEFVDGIKKIIASK